MQSVIMYVYMYMYVYGQRCVNKAKRSTIITYLKKAIHGYVSLINTSLRNF